jgi:cytochrome c oxidase subunit 2
MFRYPGNGGVKTEGILHLPAGVPVDVAVTSRDVIHAFWIPRLAGKIDAVPGHTNLLRIQASVPGRYQGLCNEFCGSGHSGMRFDVIVHPTAEFSTAIAKPDATGKVAQ